MGQLILWIGVCAAAAYALRRHPFALVAAILVLMFLVPTVGSPLLTGQAQGPLSVHAATWLVFATVAVQLVHDPSTFTRALGAHFYLALVLAVVVTAGVLSTVEGSGAGLVVLVDQVLAPAALFFFIVSLGPADTHLVGKLRTVLLVLATAVSVIAIIQWSTGEVLFYQTGFETQYWFTAEQSRWMGTLDQPLALSFALCTVAALLIGVKRLGIQLLLLAVFAAGVLTTQSRVGILIFLGVALLVVLRSEAKFVGKVLMLAGLAVAGFFFYGSPLTAGVLDRFIDDSGSQQAREAATRFFFDTWPQFILTGGGMTSSYAVGESAGLGTSLESSILMYSVDLGVVFALLYFGSMVFIVLRGFFAKTGGGLVLAGILAVAIPQTYSSLATRSVAGILVWTILALLVVAANHRDAGPAISNPEGMLLKSAKP